MRFAAFSLIMFAIVRYTLNGRVHCQLTGGLQRRGRRGRVAARAASGRRQGARRVSWDADPFANAGEPRFVLQKK
jgi:hypothetical protein